MAGDEPNQRRGAVPIVRLDALDRERGVASSNVVCESRPIESLKSTRSPARAPIAYLKPPPIASAKRVRASVRTVTASSSFTVTLGSPGGNPKNAGGKTNEYVPVRFAD